MLRFTRIRLTALTILLGLCLAFAVSACAPPETLPAAKNTPTLASESTPEGTLQPGQEITPQSDESTPEVTLPPGQENTPQSGLLFSLPMVANGVLQTPEPVEPTTEASVASPTPFLPQPTDTPPPEVLRFAVIGDYGQGEQGTADVAVLVNSWQPEFIITTGDNNYPIGSKQTIDENVGQFYQEYIYPYTGDYGPGGDTNRFFPSLGNHDWDSESAQPYLDYFTLPGNERYYDFVWGPVHLFALNGDSREPDGVGSSSDQASWLEGRLADSNVPWQVVYTHQSPYSSGTHGPVTWMRWPFQEWGADILLSGHDHNYERLLIDGFPYIVNGLGGGVIYPFNAPVEGSQVRYNEDYGAMLVEATETGMQFQFFTRGGSLIDVYQLEQP